MQTISEQWAEQSAKCKILFEWALRFDGLDPSNPQDRETPLTDGNPYVRAYEHAVTQYRMGGPANCVEGFAA